MNSLNNILIKFLLPDIVSIIDEYASDCDIVINDLSLSIKYIDLRNKLNEININNTINEIIINCNKTFNINDDYRGFLIKLLKLMEI